MQTSIRQSANLPAVEEPRVTLSVQEMPLVSFARYVADQTGVSVICDASLDQRPVSIDVQSQRVSDVLAFVSRRLNVQTTRTGNLFYIGQLRPEDRGVLVRRVSRLTIEDLQAAASTMLSDQGRVVSIQGGLVVVSDRVEVLGRVSEMLEQVEQAPAEAWVIQLHMISMTDLRQHEMGVDVDPSADLAMTFARASGGDATQALRLGAVLSAALKLSRTSDSIRVLAQPLLTVVDGGSASHKDVESVPVPKKTTSPEGTVTTEDFERIEAGLIIKVDLRDMGSRRARLQLSAEISELTGYVESAPIVVKTTYETATIVESAGVYLLGSLQQTKERRGKAGTLGTVDIRDDRSRTWQVWARVYKIGGPASVSTPEAIYNPAADDNHQLPPDDITPP